MQAVAPTAVRTRTRERSTSADYTCAFVLPVLSLVVNNPAPPRLPGRHRPSASWRPHAHVHGQEDRRHSLFARRLRRGQATAAPGFLSHPSESENFHWLQRHQFTPLPLADTSQPREFPRADPEL